MIPKEIHPKRPPRSRLLYQSQTQLRFRKARRRLQRRRFKRPIYKSLNVQSPVVGPLKMTQPVRNPMTTTTMDILRMNLFRVLLLQTTASKSPTLEQMPRRLRTVVVYHREELRDQLIVDRPLRLLQMSLPTKWVVYQRRRTTTMLTD